MTRGYSLEQDLKLLINNPKYSDIEILCGDGQKLYSSRAILAARSEVFDGLLYNGMRESFENCISFPTINSSIMEIILEYIYTGSIKQESLTKDSIIDAFKAADYFQLSNLQDFITQIARSILEEGNSPELLSKFIEVMPLMEENILLDLLVEKVATIPLNSIEFDRLSIGALRYLLYYTYEKDKHFVTTEYEVFRYSAILAAKQVSNNAYEALIERLPTLEQIDDDLIQVESKIITDHQKITEELKPLIKYIDLRRIKGQLLASIIEPLEIVPTEIIVDVYRHKALSNILDLNDIRGKAYIWDESECGSKLIIEENKRIVHAPSSCTVHQSVRAKLKLEIDGIFEWDIVLEKSCKYAYVGVCADNFGYENFAGYQPNGWVLGSNGNCCNSGIWLNDYCEPFRDGTRITVHLDMSKRTCAFTVNGTKYPEVPDWNNLPSRLYPIVSIRDPGRCRIEPH